MITVSTFQQVGFTALFFILFLSYWWQDDISRRTKTNVPAHFLAPVLLASSGVVLLIGGIHAIGIQEFLTGLVTLFAAGLFIWQSLEAFGRARSDYRERKLYNRRAKKSRFQFRRTLYLQWLRFKKWREEGEVRRQVLIEKARLIARREVEAETVVEPILSEESSS